MKVSREVKSEINRRAYFIAQAAMRRWAAQMHAAIEADKLAPDDLGAWWPEEIQPGQGAGAGSRRLVSVGPADVCGNCDTALPEGCGGRFKGDMSCELRKRGLAPRFGSDASFSDMSPPYRNTGTADPGFDATDRLAGF